VVDLVMPETVVQPFPNWMPKWVVVLQGADLFPNSPQVTVAVASSIKEGRRPPPAPWYVFVDRSHGFDKESVIDGRTIMTLPTSRFDNALHKTTLPESFMDSEVARAVVRGLDLVRPKSQPRPPRVP